MLTKKGGSSIEYVAGLGNDQLSRTCHTEELGGTITVLHLLESDILKAGQEHLRSMRQTMETDTCNNAFLS